MLAYKYCGIVLSRDHIKDYDAREYFNYPYYQRDIVGHILLLSSVPYHNRDRRGRDSMVVGFTTTCTYAISAYHH